MKLQCFVLLSIFLPLKIFPQSIIQNSIPEGFEILDEMNGNLNNDKFNDKIIILHNKQEESILKSQEIQSKRILLIFLGNSKNEFSKVLQSNNLIYPFGFDWNFKDCFAEIIIENGQFSIFHYGGARTRWERKISFKYNDLSKTWYLMKDSYSTFYFENPSNTKTITKTKKTFGEVKIENFDINK